MKMYQYINVCNILIINVMAILNNNVYVINM